MSLFSQHEFTKTNSLSTSEQTQGSHPCECFILWVYATLACFIFTPPTANVFYSNEADFFHIKWNYFWRITFIRHFWFKACLEWTEMCSWENIHEFDFRVRFGFQLMTFLMHEALCVYFDMVQGIHNKHFDSLCKNPNALAQSWKQT